MNDSLAPLTASPYHGHVTSARPIDSIEVKIANTTRDELFDAWSPLVRRFNEMQSGPSVGVSLVWMLVKRAQPMAAGRWIASMPTEEEFFDFTGMKRSSHHKARSILIATGLARWSKLGKPWLVLFEDAEAATAGEPDPQPKLFATADESPHGDLNSSARARTGSPGRALHEASESAETNAVATERASMRARANDCAPGRTDARARANFLGCSGSGQLTQSFDLSHHQIGEEFDDDLNAGFQGNAIGDRQATGSGRIGSPPEVTQTATDPREAGLAMLDSKLREQFTGWVEKLDGESSDAMIERCIVDLGVGRYRAKRQARYPELTGFVLAELIERFAQYVGRVRNHGSYLASMIEDAREAIRAQASADRVDRIEGRAAEAADLQQRIDGLTDRGFAELAVRCKVWPTVDHPTQNGKPLRGFRTLYLEVAQKAMKAPALLEGLEAARA